MNAVDGDVVAAASVLLAAKAELRNWIEEHYSILGIADHGGSPHSNGDIWEHYTVESLGFEYEAYQLQRSTTTLLTDNRGQWQRPPKHAQTFMLIHPIWWPV
jgi:pyruvate dehydrogenase complex dehydrogenase (E1) component